MQIKILYDTHFQTVEVTEEECAQMIRADYEERLAASADPSTVQPRSAQEIFDERFNKPEYNNHQTEHRRHCSLDDCYFDGDPFVDPQSDVALDMEREDLLTALAAAMDELQPQQKELVYRIFYNGEKAADIAKECGVSKAAIHDRLSKIYAVLRKKLKDF